MRSPEFWGPGGAHHSATLALTPFALIYRGVAAARRALIEPARAAIPIMCVGNLVTGGAGKTPTALALNRLVRELGGNAHFLTRGYGGQAGKPLRVDPERHTAHDVGDEALLLAAEAPTWRSADRVAAAAAAAAGGAGLVIMDDGLQNPSLTKDLSFVVIDGGFGFGNGRVLPAGPLREPVARGLAHVDAIVMIGPDRVGLTDRLKTFARPVFTAELVPGPEALRFRDQPIVAFAGIGRPAKFFETLTATGAVLVERHGFADHHRYTPDEIMRLCEAASHHGNKPVTTTKDYMRLPPEARLMVDVLSVDLEWRDPMALRALIAPLVERSRQRATDHG
ncbi:MAG: tetraacyldisaccharide 4'-kinase [Alphaproteobacteria bacterium]|nr:tetraacyldisaccharide 4'-kinase [Alphaproteobacteria bacterium]